MTRIKYTFLNIDVNLFLHKPKIVQNILIHKSAVMGNGSSCSGSRNAGEKMKSCSGQSDEIRLISSEDTRIRYSSKPGGWRNRDDSQIPYQRLISDEDKTKKPRGGRQQ